MVFQIPMIFVFVSFLLLIYLRYLIVERKFIGILGTLLAVIAIWFEKKKLKNEK